MGHLEMVVWRRDLLIGEERDAHVYRQCGNFTASLTATNLGGTNVMTRVGYVNVTAINRTTNIGIYQNGVWYLGLRRFRRFGSRR